MSICGETRRKWHVSQKEKNKAGGGMFGLKPGKNKAGGGMFGLKPGRLWRLAQLCRATSPSFKCLGRRPQWIDL